MNRFTHIIKETACTLIILFIISVSAISAQPTNTGGVAFNGDGYIEVANHESIEIKGRQITVEFWMKHDGTSDKNAFIVGNRSVGEEHGFAVKLTDNPEDPHLTFTTKNRKNNTFYAGITSEMTFEKDTWYHIAFAYNNGSIFLIVNGEVESTEQVEDADIETENHSLVIGSEALKSGNFFHGQIDEVRIWSKQLSALEVRQNMTSDLQGDESGLAAYFPMSNSSGTAVKNKATSINGELVGSATLAASGALPVAPVLYAKHVEEGAKSKVKLKITQPDYTASGIKNFNIYRYRKGEDPVKILTTGPRTDNTSHVLLDEPSQSAIKYFYNVSLIDNKGRESDFSRTDHVTSNQNLGGNALYLEGGAYAEVEKVPSLDISGKQLSIEFWMKHEGVSPDQDAVIIANKAIDATDGYLVKLSSESEVADPRLIFTLQKPSHSPFVVRLTSDITFAAGDWYHISAVYDHGEVILYVNGQKDKVINEKDLSINTEDKNLFIGVDANKNYPYKGAIDELRIWNRPLGVSEIVEHMDHPIFGDKDGLMGYWRFNDDPNTSEEALGSAQKFRANLYNALLTPSLVFGTETKASTLLSPEDGSSELEAPVVFSWSRVKEASDYSFQVSNNSNFTDLEFETTLTDTSITYSNLLEDSTYHWRVKSLYGNGAESDWSEVHSFVMAKGKIEGPELISPAHELEDVSIPVLFKWNEIINFDIPGGGQAATHYEIRISQDSGFKVNTTTIPEVADTTFEYADLNNTTTYFWKVRAHFGTEDTSRWSTARLFTTALTVSPPVSPELMSPKHDKLGVPVNTYLVWGDVEAADSYKLQVATDESFEDLVYPQPPQKTILPTMSGAEVPDEQYVARKIEGLNNAENYYWRVKSVNRAGESEWSDSFLFSTLSETHAGPTLISPKKEAESVTIPTVFNWNEIADASYYELQISERPAFDTTYVSIPDIQSLTYEYDGLKDTTTYYWRVRTSNDVDESSAWSAARMFVTELRTPEIPAWEPGEDANDVSTEVTLSWSESIRGEVYQLQLSDKNNFEAPLVETGDLEETFYKVEDELQGETTYFWRVRAGNESGYSDWSKSLRFTTQMSTSLEDEQPRKFSLHQNYPNPFNPSTVVRYQIPKSSSVQLAVFNMLGERIATLVNRQQPAGSYEASFDASKLSSGIYIYRIRAGNFSEIKKMMLIK